MAAQEHRHLWHAGDGTGLHARPGELVVDAESGRVCCHLCGRWFRSLASHVRAHGHTAESYRTMARLCSGLGLVGPALSSVISARQADRYRESARVRDDLAHGQQLARTGELAGRARAARARPVATPLQREAIAADALARGRASMAARRAAEREALARAGGHASLAELVRVGYAAGRSLEELGRSTRLSRRGLRAILATEGVELRAPGENTESGRRARARRHEDEAARRVGTDDLAGWLAARRTEGWSLAQLARATGRSYHWVGARLAA